MSKQVIICVDDEPMVLRSLKAELKAAIDESYRIELAEDGHDALELIAQLLEDGCEIPLIIADYMMPTMQGDELLGKVHELSPKTLKVMLTGQADVEAIGSAIKHAKLYRYIAKPWQAEDLQLTIQEALNSYLQEKKLVAQTAELQQMNQALEYLNREQAVLISKLQENESRLSDYQRNLEAKVLERTAALQESEQTLARSRDFYLTLFEFFPALIWRSGLDTQFNYFNQAWLDFTGHPLEQAIGDGWVKGIHPDHREAFFTTYLQAFAARQPFEMEYRLRRWDGEYRWLVDFGSPFTDLEGNFAGYIGSCYDITDRKRAEAASILEERNRMAREIHDILAQAFTGILLHVGAALEIITQKPSTAQTHLETVDELARTGLAEARRSVTALRPQLLEQGNLATALQHLTTQMQVSSQTHLTCAVAGIAYALAPHVENHLLRISQEALTNAVKHANATKIHVSLVCEETQCILRVKDDGQGFEVGQIALDRGFGLLGMSERAEQIGGELIILSQPGQGTEVIMIVNQE